jgi:hypothetical protein
MPPTEKRARSVSNAACCVAVLDRHQAFEKPGDEILLRTQMHGCNKLPPPTSSVRKREAPSAPPIGGVAQAAH